MRPLTVARATAPAPAPAPAVRESELGDLRFRGLLSDEAWEALPPAIRRRFTKRMAAGHTTVYVGEVFETWMSKAGWCVAQAARLIGAPLPLAQGVHLPSVVTVSEDAARGGQIWTRMYARRAGVPQVIQSLKRFAGPTGLEEHVGRGLSVALTLHVEDDALVFRSAGFFVQLAGLRLALPAWATPGVLSVIHAELGDGRFSFTLQLVHPRFGLLMRQMAAFREAERSRRRARVACCRTGASERRSSIRVLQEGRDVPKEEEGMAQTDAPGVMTGKPLIESDRVEGTTVYDAGGNSIGSIKRLMIEKMSGQVAYAVMSFGGFLGLGEQEHTIPWKKLDYDTSLGGYRTDITEEQLRGAPGFYRERDYDWADRRRERELHDYWRAPYYWGGL
jgi:hypothetical protein